MEKSLLEMKVGEKGIIARIIDSFGRGRWHGCGRGVRQLENIGIRVGRQVQVVSYHPFGPVVVEVDGRRTALGRGRAAKIYVEV